MNRSRLQTEQLIWKAIFRAVTGLPHSIISKVYKEEMVKRKEMVKLLEPNVKGSSVQEQKQLLGEDLEQEPNRDQEAETKERP